MLEPINVANMVRNFLRKKPSIKEVVVDGHRIICRGDDESSDVIITVERRVP